MLACCLPLLAAGCGDSGPPTGTAHGKVTIGGAAPAEPVLIYFINSTIGSGGATQTAADGTYAIDEPMRVGEYTIYFEKIVHSEGPVGTDQEQLKSVPKEYRNEASSPLKKNVDEGDNTIDIDVPKT